MCSVYAVRTIQNEQRFDLKGLVRNFNLPSIQGEAGTIHNDTLETLSSLIILKIHFFLAWKVFNSDSSYIAFLQQKCGNNLCKEFAILNNSFLKVIIMNTWNYVYSPFNKVDWLYSTKQT